MRLNLVERRRAGRPRPPFPPQAWADYRAIVDTLGAADWQVDVVLVEDEAMLELNRDFRGGDGVTDVLSFSYLEQEGPGDPDLERGAGGAAGDLWVEASSPDEAAAATVGEVVLAPGFVAGRCRERGWDVDAEWPLLVVHGCLHILGWEHGTDQERAAMQEIETELLALRGFAHPLRKRG